MLLGRVDNEKQTYGHYCRAGSETCAQGASIVHSTSILHFES